jgi:hypothetical protein
MERNASMLRPHPAPSHRWSTGRRHGHCHFRSMMEPSRPERHVVWWDQTTDGTTMPVGDDGFAGFYKASYQRLLGQLFAVTGDLAEAENVLQEAYARAFARWAQVRAYDFP